MRFHRTRRMATGFLVVVWALTILAAAAIAQSETGQIVGKVTDPNGALVSGAAISDNLESNDRLTNRVSALQPDDLLCPARF